jgi:hypothetical protein
MRKFGMSPPPARHGFQNWCSETMVCRAVLSGSRAVLSSAAPWGCVVLASLLLHAPRAAAFGTGASCSAPVGLPGGVLAPARKIARTGLTMATPAEFEGVYNFNHVITMSSACVTWCWQLLVLHPRSHVTDLSQPGGTFAVHLRPGGRFFAVLSIPHLRIRHVLSCICLHQRMHACTYLLCVCVCVCVCVCARARARVRGCVCMCSASVSSARHLGSNRRQASHD